MTGQNLAITFACMTILSGCANIGDSIRSHLRGLPDDTPKGYATYLEAQDMLKEKNYSSAAILFCCAAELGYSKANSKCAQYSIIKASVDAQNHPVKTKGYQISESSEQSTTAWLMKLEICDAAQYGEPAKSMCKKIESLSDAAVIKTVHNAKNQYFNDLNKQRIRSVKQKNQELNLKLEEF